MKNISRQAPAMKSSETRAKRDPDGNNDQRENPAHTVEVNAYGLPCLFTGLRE